MTSVSDGMVTLGAGGIASMTVASNAAAVNSGMATLGANGMMSASSCDRYPIMESLEMSIGTATPEIISMQRCSVSTKVGLNASISNRTSYSAIALIDTIKNYELTSRVVHLSFQKPIRDLTNAEIEAEIVTSIKFSKLGKL